MRERGEREGERGTEGGEREVLFHLCLSKKENDDSKVMESTHLGFRPPLVKRKRRKKVPDYGSE